MLLELLQTAGLLRSTNITPLLRYYEPLRDPLVFHRLPGVSGYTVSLLRRFRGGTRRRFPLASSFLPTRVWPPPPHAFPPHHPARASPRWPRPTVGCCSSVGAH